MSINIEIIFYVLNGQRDQEYKNKESGNTILEILGEHGLSNGGGAINCTPGKKPSGCYNEAIFISLSNPLSILNLKSDQIIPLKEMLPMLLKQVLVDCYNSNKKITLITDSIDTKVFKKWEPHFDLLEKIGIELNIFYIGGKKLQNINNLIFD